MTPLSPQDVKTISAVLGVLCCVTLVGAMIVLRSRRRHRDLSPSCGECGYCARGLPTTRCPECGSDLRDVGVSVGSAPTALRRHVRIGAWAVLILLSALLAGVAIELNVVSRPPLYFHANRAKLEPLSGDHYSIMVVVGGEGDLSNLPFGKLLLTIATRSGLSDLYVDAPTFRRTDWKLDADDPTSRPLSTSEILLWMRELEPELETEDDQLQCEADELLGFLKEIASGANLNDASAALLSFQVHPVYSQGLGRYGAPPWLLFGQCFFWLAVWFAGARHVRASQRNRDIEEEKVKERWHVKERAETGSGKAPG